MASVTATEVTYGANGWHPHFHILVIMQGQQDQAVSALDALLPVWLACLRGQGLAGERAALQAQGAAAAGAYVSAFGAAEEVALSGHKAGRQGSRSPWQLLNDARDGDRQAAALWIEYAAAFRGRRQLVWSRGAKARFGIDEISDDEAAAEAAAEVETVRVWPRSAGAGRWRQARRRRCALLDAAEAGGDLDAAEYGATDAERWRRRGRAAGDPPA